VRRIVEREGGSCGYEPVAGGGSRFYFVLPVADDSMHTLH
jgi:signal transduction histidine kinase